MTTVIKWFLWAILLIVLLVIAILWLITWPAKWLHVEGEDFADDVCDLMTKVIK